MTKYRKDEIANALQLLPSEFSNNCEAGINGECVSTDEAEVWKRVLNYRLTLEYKPNRILETHTGLGVGTKIFKSANPEAEIISLSDFRDTQNASGIFDFIDIDPFGFPYEAINLYRHKLNKGGILAITSGEIISIVRNLKNSFLKTDYKGINAWKFVTDIYIPYTENITGLKCGFFYAYPTSVRIFLSDHIINNKIFEGCPRWMWWFSKYANK